jgi:hypothetical protein
MLGYIMLCIFIFNTIKLSVIMLGVIMVSVIMLRIIMLNAIMPRAVTLRAIMLSASVPASSSQHFFAIIRSNIVLSFPNKLTLADALDKGSKIKAVYTCDQTAFLRAS